VASDGHVIGPPKIFDLGEAHFMHKLEDAVMAIGHEKFSMSAAFYSASAATYMSISSASLTPLANDWTSLASLALSGPILWTLYRGKSGAKRDLHRVQRIRGHFEEHGDPNIMRALGAQLEGLDESNYKPADKMKLDAAVYKKDFCIETNLSAGDLHRANDKTDILTASKKHNWFVEKAMAPVNIIVEMAHLVKEHKAFRSDVKLGHVNSSEQRAIAKAHISDVIDTKVWNARFALSNCFKGACDVLAYKSWQINDQIPRTIQDAFAAPFNKGRIQTYNHYTPFPRAEPLAANDNAEPSAKDIAYENEVRRLQRERKGYVKTMLGTNYSFFAEHGFFALEVANGSMEMVQGAMEKDLGKGLVGVWHTLCGFAALSPMQEVVHENQMAYNNFNSSRLAVVSGPGQKEAAAQNEGPSI
jgi:hypothetical protein